MHKLEALKKYGHHVIFISEKGRASYGNPSMSGSKETGEIEYAGDAVYDVMKVSEDTSEPWVVKNRHYKFTGMLTSLVRGELVAFPGGRTVVEQNRLGLQSGDFC